MLDFDKIYCMDCLSGMKQLDTESIDAIVTSPPYYNAREYSQWESVEAYIADMQRIFTEAFRTLKNHHSIVVNVGDVVSKVGSSNWNIRKLPLGAYFISMLENIGFTFIDDYIWDKGEPQSKRNLGNPPYPYYQYPVNCYEHILIFSKHILDKNKIPCPDCKMYITQSNGQTGIGVQSWECKNPGCPTKSAHGRGKRFSVRTVMMNDYQRDDNLIPDDFLHRWRRDIVRITPVVKINCKGENTIEHSAPFPTEIPEMAIRFFSGVGDVVCDMFSGSGTTCIAAKNLNRHFIGFEINTEYHANSIKRLIECKN